MGAIHLYPNYKSQSMIFYSKLITAAELISKAKEVVRIAHPRPILYSNLHSAVVRRTMATMSKDAIDPRDLDPIFEQKRSLRSKIRKQLKNMDPVQRSQEDDAIQNIILESPWFRASKSICAYISSVALHEVDTSRIISEVLSNPTKEMKKLYVPRVEDRNSNMKMLMISRVDDLIPNSMNILEPALVDSDGNQREDAMQASDPVNLIIVPGLAFDKSGGRLGRSGGYYDLFLKKYRELTKERKWKQPLLVALSYSLQILEEGAIPITPYDVPVDGIVSPAGFIPTSTAALEI